MKIPIHVPKEVLLQMAGIAINEEPISKHKFLIVDDELYGKVEFPRSMLLGRGQKLKFPGYGEVQVLEATLDTLRCTTTIDEGLYDEWTRNPPPTDPTPAIQPSIPAGLLRELAAASGNAALAQSIAVRIPGSCGTRKRDGGGIGGDQQSEPGRCGELDTASSTPSRFL